MSSSFRRRKLEERAKHYLKLIQKYEKRLSKIYDELNKIPIKDYERDDQFNPT